MSRSVLLPVLKSSTSAIAPALAAYYGAWALITIWQLGWSELFADQFRQYARLLRQPFPDNALTPDNGHRQITSNLLRLADIHWGHGDQRIGVIAGLLVIGLVLALLLVRIWRDQALSLAARGAATLLASIAVLWFGSARMQFHGNESFQVYLVIAAALVVLAAVERMRQRPGWGPVVLAMLAAGIAALSFAMGMAVVGLLLAMMLIRRIELRLTGPTALAVVVAVAAYVFLLPGGEGIRATLDLAPWQLARNTSTWLASFWTTSWLSYADGGWAGNGAQFAASLPFGTALIDTARLVFTATGNPSLLVLAGFIGLAGLCLLGLLLVSAWRRPEQVGSMAALGIGLAVFAAGVAVLVALARGQLFAAAPGQVLADRYVLWTNLFWLGLALPLMARMDRSRFGRPASVLLALLVGAMVYPSHRIGQGWAAAVEREIERRAAQIETGVLAPGFDQFADMSNRPTAEAAIAVLRERQIGMFRAPRNRLIGASVKPADARFAELAVMTATDRVPELATTTLPGWHIEGRLIDATLRPDLDGVLIADATGTVIGLGEFSYRSQPAPFRWQRVDRIADGFDAYFRAHPPCAGLILYGVDAAATRFVPLARLPDCAATAP